MTLFFIFLIIAGLIAIQFLSHRLSPVPYFPTNSRDIPLVVQALSLKNGQTVVDMGAGDGVVVFAAAAAAHEKGLTTQFVAVENNFVLVALLYLRRLIHPARANVSILMADMFTLDTSTIKQFDNATIYLYVSPWLISKLVEGLKSIKKPFTIVSYFYPITGLKESRKIQGVHPIFVYHLPHTLRRG